MSKEGKKYEADIEKSCNKLNMFNFRVRDVLHTSLKPGHAVPRNKYDFIIYKRPYLLPMELKSTKDKTFSFSGSNPKIKEHQIKALTKDGNYDGVIAGLLLNFREPKNRTFFIHIDDFNNYAKAAQEGLQENYKAKINRSSIPLRICEEIGIEVEGKLMRTRYFYRLDKLIDELIKKYV